MSDVVVGRKASRGAVPVERNPSGLPARRRWGRLAIGIGMVLAAVWITVSLVGSAGERTRVVAMARDVGRYETIGRDDLRSVGAALDAGIDWVPATDLDDLLGRVAATELVAGELLSLDQLVPEGQEVLAEGDAVVGTRLTASELPPDVVRPGIAIVVVVRDANGGEVDQVEGSVLRVGDVDASTGERVVSLVVPASAAADVSAAAAEDRVSVVSLEA
jgi:hypothetical protein